MSRISFDLAPLSRYPFPPIVVGNRDLLNRFAAERLRIDIALSPRCPRPSYSGALSLDSRKTKEQFRSYYLVAIDGLGYPDLET